MIQAIWIINETGQCIFSHKYVHMDIEDQLVSGLLTAFDAFSNESGIGGVQQIGGENSQFVYGSTGKILVAALADKIDNEELVEKLMQDISRKFQKKYADYLQDPAYIDVNVFEGFEKEIDAILFPKIFRRGVGSTIFATIITMAFTAGVLLMMINYINVSNAIFLVFLACVPGLFIGSLVAGKRSYALLSSTIGILPIIGFTAYVMYISNPLESSILYIVLMAQQYLTIAVICAIIGGGLIEKRRLFPLQEKEETKARIAVQKETIPPPPPDYQQTQPPTYQQAPQPQKQSNDEDYYAEQSFKNDEW